MGLHYFDYTGIRTSHVFKQGIEPGSTAWKSRALTTQPATQYKTHCDIYQIQQRKTNYLSFVMCAFIQRNYDTHNSENPSEIQK